MIIYSLFSKRTRLSDAMQNNNNIIGELTNMIGGFLTPVARGLVEPTNDISLSVALKKHGPD